MQARQMATALCECFREELAKIPSLDTNERSLLLREVDDYNQRLFKWLQDGKDNEDLDSVEHESLTLEYTSLVKRLRDLQRSARTEQDIAPTKRQRIWTGIKGFVKEAYRITIKSFFDSAMNK